MNLERKKRLKQIKKYTDPKPKKYYYVQELYNEDEEQWYKVTRECYESKYNGYDIFVNKEKYIKHELTND